MISVQKLYDDLDYWLMIGIADDIVNIPTQRLEYQHLVKEGKSKGIPTDSLAIYAHEKLKFELLEPWWKRRTFWRLILLSIRKALPLF